MARATIKFGRGWQRRLRLVQEWKRKTGGTIPPEQLDELLPVDGEHGRAGKCGHLPAPRKGVNVK
jgi:hypothetical protein